MANKKSLFRTKIVKAPTRSAAVLKELIEELPEHIKADVKNNLNLASESDCMTEVCTKVIHNIKNKFGEQSSTALEVINLLGSYLKDKSVTDIQKICKLRFENAQKVKNQKKLVHKVYKKKITQEVIFKIENFYEREDISRVEPSQKKVSKKWGPRKYMNFSVKDAYLTFRSENPEVQVSYSKFHMLRPKNVRVTGKTPLVSSLCPYCLNIRLKLQKLHIPELKMEYDLFNNRVCKTNHKQILENDECISKSCKKCNDWEGTIDTLLADVSTHRNITLYTCQKDVRKNGKKGSCRNLVCKTEPFQVFKNELINDVLHPTQRVTFVEHFMAQKIQLKMYNDCYSYLKPRQCIMVHDFFLKKEKFQFKMTLKNIIG